MLSGGLGNQMFQYAFARALQEKGVNVAIDDRTWWLETGRDDFTGTRRDLGISHFHIAVPKIDCYRTHWKRFFMCYQRNWLDSKITQYVRKKSSKSEGNYLYERGLDRISFDELLTTDKNYYFNSYFQNPTYFDDIKEILRKDFTLCESFEVPQHIKELLANRSVIALHVRRGDYVRLGETLGGEYFEQAVRKIGDTLDNPAVFLFSDDLGWAGNLDIPYETYPVNADRSLADYEELMLMSYCHHFVISNSTFSWWAAWLSSNEGKIVIAPKTWFQDGTNGQIVPGDWITM